MTDLDDYIKEIIRQEVAKQMHALRTEMIGAVPHDFPTMKRIMEAVAKEWRVFVVDILSHGRGRHVTLPRHIAMYLVVTMTAHTQKEIANAFNRDPTTVWNGQRRVEHLMRHDEVLCRRVNALMDRLESARKVA